MSSGAEHNGRHKGGRCFASGKHVPDTDLRLTG